MEKWKLKEILKIVIRCFIIATIFFSILMIFSGAGIETFNEFLFPIIWASLGILGILFLIYIVTNLKKSENEIKSKDYYRDINPKITPAIGALVVDKYLEKNEAILATILDLNVRKYIDIKKENDKLEINILNKNIDSLYLHEKYVIESIKSNSIIELVKFKELVEKDCVEEKLFEENNKPKIFVIIIFLLLLLTAIIFGIISQYNVINKVLYATIAKYSIIGLIIFVVILRISIGQTSDYNLTEEGKKVAKENKELKNFLKDYTLLKERDINYLMLADRYLPFALALGQAKKLENLYIAYNDLISKYVEKEEKI